MNLLRDGHQTKLELRPRLNHSAALIPDVLQGGRDVDLLAGSGHPVQHHVDEDVGAGAADAVRAVHGDGARPAAVRFVDLAAELQQGPGGRRDPVGGPRPEVELRDGPRLAGPRVLQVDRPDEVVVAPDVLADQVHLEDVVLLRAFFRPVTVAQLMAVVLQAGQHDDDHAALLPNHLPKVGHRRGQGGLRGDVGRRSGVVGADGGRVDVVGAGGVDHRVEDHAVVIVGEFIRVSVLLLVLGLEG